MGCKVNATVGVNRIMTCMNQTAKNIIYRVLNCAEHDIQNVQILVGGNTNITFSFEVFGVRYVYRQPGNLTENFIDRKAEQFTSEKASKLKVGEEILYMDDTGIKVSKFIDQTKEFDFSCTSDIKAGVALLRKLHGACIEAPFKFDHLQQIETMKACMDQAARSRWTSLENVYAIEVMVQQLDVHVKNDNWPKCLIHGDPKGPNILVSADRYTLIDWEYAGVKDIGYDISHYAAEIGRARSGGHWELDPKDAAWYFNAIPTNEQYRHILACFAIEEYYWTLWAIQKNRSDIVVRCYNNAARFAERALKLYTPNPCFFQEKGLQ